MDRSLRFQSGGGFSYRLTTIALAVVTNRKDWLVAMAEMPVLETAENAAFVKLCNTLLFAALDRVELAQENWRQYAQQIGGKRSADEFLSVFLVAELPRRKVLAILVAKGIVAPDGTVLVPKGNASAIP